MKDLTKGQKSFLFTGCYYAFFLNGIIGLILGSLLPMLRSTYHLDYSIGGTLISAHSVGNLISGFIAGIVPLYLGQKNALLLLCSSTALGFAGMILTGNPLFLILAFLLTGIGRGSVSNFDNVIVAEASDGDPKALNILHSFFAVGAFIAPFLVLLCTKSNPENWKLAALIVVILALIMLVCFAIMKIDNKRPEKAEKKKLSFSFFKDPHFLISTGILFFYLCTETAINGWLVTYFKDAGIMGDAYAQTLASLLWLVILFGRLFCAWISQKVSKGKLLLLMSIGSLFFFVALMATKNLTVITASIVGLGFCMAGIYPTTIANLGNVIKGSPMAMGTLLAAAGLGAIIMPIVTGVAATHIGIIGGMSLISISALLNFLFALLNFLRSRKKLPESA